jgi:tetratricopeptide (TPR) repeat protein
LQALVAAVADDRPVEARLSGGFAYAPMRSNLRGESSTPSLRPDIRIAAARIEKEALVRRSPEVLRALGLAYLVVGDLDKAVPVFEEAIDRPNPDARLLSDAAAAYLARANKSDHPQDLAKALTMADRAVKTAPNLAEALFNKAYALEKLSLTAEARQAWQDYLAVDNSSDGLLKRVHDSELSIASRVEMWKTSRTVSRLRLREKTVPKWNALFNAPTMWLVTGSTTNCRQSGRNWWSLGETLKPSAPCWCD